MSIFPFLSFLVLDLLASSYSNFIPQELYRQREEEGKLTDETSEGAMFLED